jgi:hypothetical protein
MAKKDRSRGDDLRQAIKGQVRHPYITGQGLAAAGVGESATDALEAGQRRSCDETDARRDSADSGKDLTVDEQSPEDPHSEHPSSQDLDAQDPA